MDDLTREQLIARCKAQDSELTIARSLLESVHECGLTGDVENQIELFLENTSD